MSMTSLHQRADKRAKEDDAKWFVSHPARKFRIRDIKPFEVKGPIETYPGIKRQTIVAQICPGVRMRTLVRIIFFGINGQLKSLADNDVDLCDAFVEQLSPQRLAEYRAALTRFAPRNNGGVA